MTCHFCPNCGYDVVKSDKPITVGRLTIGETTVLIDGNPSRLTTDQVAILRCLALAYPHPVKLDAMILRLDKQELEDAGNGIAVQVHRIRKELRWAGLEEDTLRTIYGRGYQLTDPVRRVA